MVEDSNRDPADAGNVNDCSSIAVLKVLLENAEGELAHSPVVDVEVEPALILKGGSVRNGHTDTADMR